MKFLLVALAPLFFAHLAQACQIYDFADSFAAQKAECYESQPKPVEIHLNETMVLRSEGEYVAQAFYKCSSGKVYFLEFNILDQGSVCKNGYIEISTGKNL